MEPKEGRIWEVEGLQQVIMPLRSLSEITTSTFKIQAILLFRNPYRTYLENRLVVISERLLIGKRKRLCRGLFV